MTKQKTWNDLKANERIVRARSLLVMSQPFYGTLALYLKPEAMPEIASTATDGERLVYNPAYVESVSEAECVGLVAHEVSHCAYRHMTRRGGRDHPLWNKACDYALNLDVLAAGFKLPDGLLIDQRFRGKAAEEIYAMLVSEAEQEKGQPKPGQGSGQPQSGSQGQSGEGKPNGAQDEGQGGDAGTGQPNGSAGKIASQCGDNHGGCCGVPDSAADAGSKTQSDAEWDVRVRQALGVAAAHGCGNLPAHLQRMADAIRKPTEDWRDRLRSFIDCKGRGDFSWTQPNKRLAGLGYVLPGQSPDSMHKLAVVIDTSGSISQYALQLFRAELQAALDDGVADELVVLYAGNSVEWVEHYSAQGDLEFNAKGGGGTDFAPAFAWIAENEPEAAAIIYFTDLECASFGEAHAPVLWACQPGTKDQYKARVPFGEIVQIV